MRRRWVLVAAASVALLGGLAWRAWPSDPGPVAPQLTARQLALIDRHEPGTLTFVRGGSRFREHQLWEYYSHRRPYDGVRPRLLAVSRVERRGTHSFDGIYWLVYSDRVWQFSFGPDGGGDYSREAVFVPDDGSSMSGHGTTF